jgi:lipopolysaccharide/colanic/teichoic acid biosynthesis glycosyltransferase
MTITAKSIKDSLSSAYLYNPEMFQMRIKEELIRSHRTHEPFLVIEIPTKNFNFWGFEMEHNELLQAWKIAVLTIFSQSNEVDIKGYLPKSQGISLIWINKTDKDIEKVKKLILRNLREADLLSNIQLKPTKPFFQVFYHMAQVESDAQTSIRNLDTFNQFNEGFFNISPLQYSDLKHNNWQGPLINAAKRCIDFVGAAFGIILLSPLFLAIYLIMKITELKGTIIFTQTRVGINGTRFKMYKFRSMYMDADERLIKLKEAGKNEVTGPAFKMKNDPRITPLGRFIRKYSIDELPQMWNVLIGDMALVGPRPPIVNEVMEYLPWHKMRLAVKPGLTCHWQVSGRSDLDFDEWMRLDNKYVRHGNLATDMSLIRRTFVAVIKGDGAY